jgi:RimJ/RimL family protein N-acetyltransferase
MTSPHLSSLLALRPVTPDDFEALYTFQHDPASHQMAVATPRPRDNFWAHWTKIIADPNVMLRAITVDNELVGNVTCFRMKDPDTNLDADLVGYWISQAWWGKGVASHALALLLREVTIRPLYAWVATTNTGSRRVLEKCGFRHQSDRYAPASEWFPACDEAVYVLE